MSAPTTPDLAGAATLADVPALVELMAEFYAEAGFPLDTAWAERSFTALLSQPALGAAWLVRAQGEPAGYAVLTVRHSMEHGGPDAFIDDLFVRTAQRRRGVARAAMAALFAECRRRGILALHVEVGPDNSAANTLYAHWGMELRSDARQVRTVVLA